MDAPPTPEIVIVAPRLPEAPGEAAYSLVEIEPARIAEAARLDEALRAAAGVSTFRRNSSSATNPTIQGLSVRASAPSGAGRTLVTLDGLPLNDPFGGWVIWGAIPLDTIQSARIFRGAGAGPYGAGALLGAVELQESTTRGAALALEGGELGTLRAYGFSIAGDNALSLMLAANIEQSDGWVPVRDGRGAADAPLASDAAAAVARLQWRSASHVASVRLAGHSEARGAGLVGANSANTGSSLSLVLARPRGPFGWRVQAWAMQSDLQNSSVAVAPDRASATPANDQYATPAFGWGGNAALRWTNETGGVELGADVRAADGETRELFRFQGSGFTRSRIAGGETLLTGAYLEAWRQMGPWLFTGGARLDEWHAFGGERAERNRATNALTLSVEPKDNSVLSPTARFGARRDMGDGRFVRAAAYAGFRPPTLNELHRPFRVGNDVTEANAALEPERLLGVDAAIGDDSDIFSWSVGVFATRLEDAIVNVTLGVGPGTFPPGVFVPAGGVFRQRQNAGVIDALGVEAEAEGRLRRSLSWRASLNYADARIDALRPAQSPEWSATAGLRWDAAAATRLSADLFYESARFEDDLNSRELASAFTLDMRVDQHITRHVSVYAALDNAFDAAVETAETADGIESFGPPRSFRLGLRWRSSQPE